MAAEHRLLCLVAAEHRLLCLVAAEHRLLCLMAAEHRLLCLVAAGAAEVAEVEPNVCVCVARARACCCCSRRTSQTSSLRATSQAMGRVRVARFGRDRLRGVAEAQVAELAERERGVHENERLRNELAALRGERGGDFAYGQWGHSLVPPHVCDDVAGRVGQPNELVGGGSRGTGARRVEHELGDPPVRQQAPHRSKRCMGNARESRRKREAR